MFLDTSGLICYLHRSEPGHAEAARLMLDATYRFTHSYVLAELVALAQVRRLPRSPILDFLDDIQAGRIGVELIFVDAGLHAAAVELLRDRPDKAWSLCDAVSFVAMEAREDREALTFDHHFEQAGFRACLRP